jgi:hypothetical protein
LLCLHIFISSFLPSNIWLFITSLSFVSKSFFSFQFVLFAFSCLVKFSPFFYFLFVGEYEDLFNDFSEYTFEDSNDWDKHGSFFGPGGVRRTVI